MVIKLPNYAMYGHNGNFEFKNSELIINSGLNKKYPICGGYTLFSLAYT